MTIDVWMQHPTPRFSLHDMLASLRRWTGQEIPDAQPAIELTVAAMDQAGVDFCLLSARWPRQPALISYDEVPGWVAHTRSA